MNNCYVVNFQSPVGYKKGLEIQQRAFNMVKEKQLDGILLLLQHKPVFTLGSGGGSENLLVTKDKLEQMGIELYETSRGGNITYHGPGQIVAYPIINLRKFKKDAHWYLRQLEEVVIQTLSTYGVSASRKPEYTGVWVGDSKITAVGVYLKRWITMHGFAFNLNVDKEHFGLINPCGITEFGVASLDDYMEKVNEQEVIDRIKVIFRGVFNTELTDVEIDQLWGDADEM